MDSTLHVGSKCGEKDVFMEGPNALICVRGLPLSTYAERGRGGVGPNADVVSKVA